MNKRLIRLSEQDIHKIVKESVQKILREIEVKPKQDDKYDTRKYLDSKYGEYNGKMPKDWITTDTLIKTHNQEPDVNLPRNKRDKEGFNKLGLDKQGFKRDGYGLAGWNREGFNKEGFNKEGFDKEGFDKKGKNKENIYRSGRHNWTSILKKEIEENKGYFGINGPYGVDWNRVIRVWENIVKKYNIPSSSRKRLFQKYHRIIEDII